MRHAALAVLAALAIAGCGDELDEFRADVRPLEAQAGQQRAEIAATLRASTLGSRADARALRGQTTTLARTFDEIARLEPPDGYEKPFADYVRANTLMVRALREFAAALSAGSARRLRMLSRRVVRGLGESQSARLRWLE